MIEKIKENKELWDLYTRKEEYDSLYRDKWDRFAYYMSGERDIMRPKVSEYLFSKGMEPHYPEDKPFAVCLTHDIDIVYPTKTGALFEMVKTGKNLQVKKASDHLLSAVQKKKSKWWNFSEIIALEEKYDAKSSYYFMAQKKGELDHRYELSEVRTEMGNITDQGSEIGLHGGHTAYNNYEHLTEQKKRLEKALGRKVTGYRNHFLHFSVPDTWELLAKAGFGYDATYGYADMIGFRSGMCHPYKPYNLKTEREIDMIEIPLTVMDGTLFDYMRLDQRTAWEMTKKLIDTVAENRGVFTLLWHNTYMMGDMKKFYEKILAYCREKDAWMTSCQSLCDSL
jgi:hypothetical protein